MKILKIILFLIFIFGLELQTQAQTLDCPSTLALRHPTPPFKLDDLSKSAACYTGRKYEFLLPLTKGKDYRISFYASPIFNNDIKFIVVDQNTGEKVLDLPGESLDNTRGTTVLRDYFDEKSGRSIHPYFDFHPATSTTLKIIIDVASLEQTTSGSSGYKPPEVRKKGCITVFIQNKKADYEGFDY